jgi:class 3 adenylate cyclase
MGIGPEVALNQTLARHGPSDAEDQLSPEGFQNLVATGSTSVFAAVVVGDLRMSGLLIREAVSASLFARYLVGFTEAVRSLALDFKGWFDKFTGDGFIAFWLYRSEQEVVRSLPGFCRSVMPASTVLVDNLKRNSRNFPVGVGLSIGIDAGPCELIRVGDEITLVGSPIVGATRMVSGAHAGQVLINVSLGSTLEKQEDLLHEVGVRISRQVVSTKEYPQGQEAYELLFDGTSPKSRGTDSAPE